MNVTDAGLEKLAGGCPLLTVLDLSCCTVTDVGLRAVAAGLPRLASLKLEFCTEVSDLGLEILAAGCMPSFVRSIANFLAIFRFSSGSFNSQACFSM